MSGSGSENDCELIIDSALLAQIQAHCCKIVAEQEAEAARRRFSAEHFAAAVPEMPANVRRFFQAEEPFVSPRRSESAQDRLEREARASFGGWAGG